MWESWTDMLQSRSSRTVKATEHQYRSTLKTTTSCKNKKQPCSHLIQHRVSIKQNNAVPWCRQIGRSSFLVLRGVFWVFRKKSKDLQFHLQGQEAHATLTVFVTAMSWWGVAATKAQFQSCTLVRRPLRHDLFDATGYAHIIPRQVQKQNQPASDSLARHSLSSFG